METAVEVKDCGGEILFVNRFKFTITKNVKNKAAKWFCDGDHSVLLHFGGTDIFNMVYGFKRESVINKLNVLHCIGQIWMSQRFVCTTTIHLSFIYPPFPKGLFKKGYMQS